MKKVLVVLISTLVCISCKKDKTENNQSHNKPHITDSISHDAQWQNFSQYIPLPKGDAVWYTESALPIWNGGQVSPNQPPDTLYTFENKIYLAGDTSINQVDYTKVIRYYNYKKYDVNLSRPPGDLVRQGNKRELHGCFRQDIMRKEVFFIEPGEQKEELLYEFGLNVGDTSSIYSNNITVYTVYCIDSINLNNRFHKVYSFLVENRDGTGSKFINEKASIEGIGSCKYGPLKKGGSIEEFSFDNMLIYSRKVNTSSCS